MDTKRSTSSNESGEIGLSDLKASAMPSPAGTASGTSPASRPGGIPPKPSRKGQTDEMLVDRVRDGDRAAFDEIYDRYFRRIYAFLDKRLSNRADSEETTQEVFINVFSSLDTYRGEAPFAAWIFGLTRRTLAARFRRKRHPMVPLFEEDEDVSFSSLTAAGQPEATPLENYEMTERANQLKQTLEHVLTPEQRKLFELHHIESMPIAEIAKALSKSEDAVKSNLYRTRKQLLSR